MEKENLQDWNRIVYLVSEVYSRTGRLRTGPSMELGNRIRKTAINISSSVNSLPELMDKTDFSRVYPIISAINVLEVYLQMAKRHRFLRNTDTLDEQLVHVKETLNRLIAED